MGRKPYSSDNNIGNYTTAEVVALTGVTKRQLDYWAWKEIIIPSISSSSGQGNFRRYSDDDVELVRVIKKLHQRGWSTQKVGKALKLLRLVVSNPEVGRNVLLFVDRRVLLGLINVKDNKYISLDLLTTNSERTIALLLASLNAGSDIVVNKDPSMTTLTLSPMLDKEAEQNLSHVKTDRDKLC